jgi:tetratricopeptide (TPR) repeat protein
MTEILIVWLYVMIGTLPLKPLTTLLHELGHAIPSLIFSRNKVSVFIGSYGDTKKNFKVPMGRLTILFHKNPLLWYKGMCLSRKNDVSFNKQIIIILMGPVATLLIAVLTGLIVFNIDSTNGAVRFISLGLLITAVSELYANLRFSNRPIKLHNGTSIGNDGSAIRQLLQLKKEFAGRENALTHYTSHEFSKALPLLLPDAERNTSRTYMYALTHCLIAERRYDEALSLYQKFDKLHQAKPEEQLMFALIQNGQNDVDGAIITSRQILEKIPEHPYALNNLGYYLNRRKMYEAAIPYLKKAFAGDPGFSYPPSNLGLSLIKTGKPEDGLRMIEHALKLEPQNATAIVHKGIYHLDAGNKSEALKFFREAKQISPWMKDIDDLIIEAE